MKTAIDGFLPNQPNGQPDYLQSGADNTLRGIAVLNALRGADAGNPLARAWANVSADPLVGPVAAHRPDTTNPDLGFEYDTVRSLFLTPEASRRFIAALDRGATLAEGSPRLQGHGSRQAGFYVSGDDFVHWNRNGEGQAFIGGRWRGIDPDDLTRVRNRDGTTELTIDENRQRATLLRVDPRAPALRAEATMAPDRGVHIVNTGNGSCAALPCHQVRDDSRGSREGEAHPCRDRDPGLGQDPPSTAARAFENPFLGRLLAAARAGDEAGARGIAREFSSVPPRVRLSSSAGNGC